jgi:hypothetical protein
MVKELVIAIVLGALLGFGATGTYFALSHKNSTPATQKEPSSEIQSDQTNSSDNSTTESSDITQTADQVVVSAPENETFVNQSTVTVKGTAPPNSFILIVTPINSYQTTATESGNFETDVQLEAGANFISVNSIDSQNNQSEAVILVTYTTAQI